jgi:hypothetical protein
MLDGLMSALKFCIFSTIFDRLRNTSKLCSLSLLFALGSEGIRSIVALLVANGESAAPPVVGATRASNDGIRRAAACSVCAALERRPSTPSASAAPAEV